MRLESRVEDMMQIPASFFFRLVGYWILRTPNKIGLGIAPRNDSLCVIASVSEAILLFVLYRLCVILLGFLIILSHSTAYGSNLIDKQQSLCSGCKEPYHFIRFKTPPTSISKPKNLRLAHPFNLKPQHWVQVLNSVRIQSVGTGLLFTELKGAASQVFTPDEIDYLAKTLSQAFAQVPANKVVAFGLSRVKSPHIIDITTGGWYVEGTRIHLLLANYRQTVTMPNILERIWRDPLVASMPADFDFVVGDHQASRQANSVGFLKSDLPEVAIDYKSLLSVKQVDTDKGVPVPSNAKPDASIDQRLRKLKQMKEEGLITEEEYLEKKKKILENY